MLSSEVYDVLSILRCVLSHPDSIGDTTEWRSPPCIHQASLTQDGTIPHWEVAPGHALVTIPCAPGNYGPFWLQIGGDIHEAVPGRIPIATNNEGRRRAPIFRRDDYDSPVYSREPYSRPYREQSINQEVQEERVPSGKYIGVDMFQESF